MVNPFILQATDAMTRIILGIHTLLLGTGGRGCCGPGIRTITATGCRERDTHRRAYGADAGRGGTPRRNRRCCRPCRFAHLYRCSPRRSRRKRRYGKNAIQNFFHNNFPSLKRRTKNAKAFHDKCENFSFRASNETAVLITAFYSLHGDHLGYG